MEGKTHRVAGALCTLSGYALLSSKGLLLSDVNPVLQLAVMYPYGIYGSVCQDMDHNWHSAPCKDVVNFFINKLLHLTTDARRKVKKPPKFTALFDAKHRSWQTHSDLFLFVMVIVAINLVTSTAVSADIVLIKLMFTGLVLGIVSHLFLDMLTPEGIWCITTIVINKIFHLKLPEKIHLVPDSSFFRTGGKWEDFIRGLLWVMCILLLVWILYTLSPYRVNFNPS